MGFGDLEASRANISAGRALGPTSLPQESRIRGASRLRNPSANRQPQPVVFFKKVRNILPDRGIERWEHRARIRSVGSNCCRTELREATEAGAMERT